jgi:hypothetical protein
MDNGQITKTEKRVVKEKYVSHSLKEIPRLIREALYGIKRNWQMVGELLLEARFLLEEKGKPEHQVASEFWDWFENQGFSFARRTAEENMAAARKYLKLKPRERADSRLKDILYPDYKQPSEEIKEKVRKSIEMSRRILARAEEQRDESDAIRELAIQIVDIGFKTLSAKFHPDRKGGSHDAMRRLNSARQLLKSYLG